MTNRELDKLVAEKVFGYGVVEHKQVGRPDWYYKDSGDLILVRPYSTNIAAAWLIVFEMEKKERGPGKFGGFQVNSDDHGWTASFWRNYAFGSSAQDAICKAALKAVGEEID